MKFYSDKRKETDKWSLPDCEVFHLKESETADYMPDGEGLEGGFFWHFCFPGCLPDSEPFGPYKTEQEALADCRKEYGESYREDERGEEIEEEEENEQDVKPLHLS
jgi:hypothetical protein